MHRLPAEFVNWIRGLPQGSVPASLFIDGRSFASGEVIFDSETPTGSFWPLKVETIPAAVLRSANLRVLGRSGFVPVFGLEQPSGETHYAFRLVA